MNFFNFWRKFFKIRMIHGDYYLSQLIVNLKTLKKGGYDKIGEGNFGTVIKGTFPSRRNQPEIPCAIKILKYTEFTDEVQERFYREIGCQASLKHETILPLLGCSIQIMKKGDYAIVTEFMEKGSLSKLIADAERGAAPQDWETIKAINIFGIAAGMAFVHKSKIIHRDLKTDNIMLDDNYHPKIADFGFSKIFEEGTQDQINMTRKVGTPICMAPEILLGKNYGNKADVFSYAMILYELFTQRKPWSDKPGFKEKKFDLVAYIEKRQRPTIHSNEIPDSFKDLIEQCWATEPDDRPSFIEIVQKLDENKEDYFNFEVIDEEKFLDYIELAKKGLN